jgi:uncharacterized membrane protein (DUF485 family)
MRQKLTLAAILILAFIAFCLVIIYIHQLLANPINQ